MKAVKVEWIDSCSSNLAWTLKSEFESGGIVPIYICTYGIVIQENKDFMVIAQNYGKEPEQFCNFMLIPKGCIKKITELK